MLQTILRGSGSTARLGTLLKESNAKRPFLVLDNSYPFLNIKNTIEEILGSAPHFSNFQPNPQYESVVEGVALFRRNRCDFVVAVGGGSALDVAKCIKLYASMSDNISYLEQAPAENAIGLLAIPTTAGTGSESTRYAVIYSDGNKQSITHDSIIPQTVILDPDVLLTLPEYQRKATMLDALCHGVESYWSVNSTVESRKYSQIALNKIAANQRGYLNNDPSSNEQMMAAANYAGQAISISQTTAGHAMCYKITSIFGIAHGHAAALCLPHIWRYMLKYPEDCTDPRGQDYLLATFQEISQALGYSSAQDAIAGIEQLLSRLGLDAPGDLQPDTLDALVDSVNLTRLKNNPVALSPAGLRQIYQAAFHQTQPLYRRHREQ